MHADSVNSSGHDEKPMSGMAVTAFVLTLIFCIPVLPLIGLLLGLGALGRTSVDGPMRGRPLAITAVILGLLMTVGQVYATVQIVKVAQIFGDSITSVITGPQESMQAAFDGDGATATTFWWKADAPSESETVAFVTAAKARFGDFKNAFPSDDAQPGAGAGQPEFTLPFTFTFSNGKVWMRPADWVNALSVPVYARNATTCFSTSPVALMEPFTARFESIVTVSPS